MDFASRVGKITCILCPSNFKPGILTALANNPLILASANVSVAVIFSSNLEAILDVKPHPVALGEVQGGHFPLID
jgi:hypothetical protein